VYPVIGQAGLHRPGAVVENRVIIDPGCPRLARDILQPPVELGDRVPGFDRRSPGKLRRRRHRSDQHLDALPLRDAGHGAHIVLAHLRRHRSGVPGNVVRAAHDVRGARTERDHVAHHAQHHLRARLAADPAVDAAALEETGPLIEPKFGDGIAHEDHVNRRLRGNQGFVVVGIIADHAEIAFEPTVKPFAEIDAGRDLLLCKRAARREQERRSKRRADQVTAIEAREPHGRRR